MHLFSSYTTGPAAVFWNAPTGQAETQLGTLQCMHIFRAKRGPRRLTTENVLSERVSDRTSSDVRGSLLRSLQAREQAPHPMQRVVSRRIPFFSLVVIMALALLTRSVFSSLDVRRVARRQELPAEGRPGLVVQVVEDAVGRLSAVRQAWEAANSSKRSRSLRSHSAASSATFSLPSAAPIFLGETAQIQPLR